MEECVGVGGVGRGAPPPGGGAGWVGTVHPAYVASCQQRMERSLREERSL